MNNSNLPEQIVGLYSFPKSGNTWLRAIIAGIAGIPDGPGTLQKYVTDTHYGKVVETPWEFQGTNWYFYKSHHKNVLTEHKEQQFVTNKIVYIHRHPLDVFMSYLNFVSNNVSPQAGASLNISFDKVEDLSPGDMEKLFSLYVAHGTIFPQNKTFGSVFENIQNFKDLRAKDGNVHIVRYEDLIDNFEGTVNGICQFVGFRDVDVMKVFTDAEKRTGKNGKFFWKKQKDNYKNYLTEDQIKRFYRVYAAEMESLGY
jgi:Sulfotransferase domain